jgi:uncharacterized protein YukE
MDDVHDLLARAEDAVQRAGALSRTVHELAAQVRDVAGSVRGVQGTPWRSVAAEAFRDRTADLASALVQAATGLDGAGNALHAHALASRRRVDEIAGLLRALESVAARGVEELADAATERLDGALPGPWRLR